MMTEWVSVEDELPEVLKGVKFYDEDCKEEVKGCFTGCAINGKLQWVDEERLYYNAVSHWQPITPPEE